jgi:hypothetical protein
MRLALGCLLLALPALAQLDSSTLRAKFGTPLNRETFHMPQGFDLTVDYGTGNQVCKLTVPADPPPPPNTSGGFNGRQKMQDFLADLVPASMRGKELNRFMASMGAVSTSWTEYEYVTIFQSESGRNDTIQVSFNDPACR